MYIGFWRESEKEEDREVRVSGDGMVWAGFIWLMIGTSGGLL
jgi:hypothetical protein